jgi:hypothetical protein
MEAATSTPTPRTPLLCRLNRHKWERRSTEDGKGYLKCKACGKDRYEVDFEHHDPTLGSSGGFVTG